MIKPKSVKSKREVKRNKHKKEKHHVISKHKPKITQIENIGNKVSSEFKPKATSNGQLENIAKDIYKEENLFLNKEPQNMDDKGIAVSDFNDTNKSKQEMKSSTEGIEE